jgi:hypothetical protein
MAQLGLGHVWVGLSRGAPHFPQLWARLPHPIKATQPLPSTLPADDPWIIYAANPL